MARLMKGNEAVVLGALLAGCESYYGYPITPASEIAQAAAEYFPKMGRTFLQAESEVAAINMVYGASAAGQRTMTASSGPGISLKAECLSYLAATELPSVVIDITRAGPGLGNIGPEQSDYNQVIKGAGHGNYNVIALAPNSVQEMCDHAILAFDLADRYRNPVFVMADGVIGQMMEPVTFPRPVTDIPAKPWASSGTAATKQGCHSSIYLDHDELEAHNLHLQKKYAEIQKKEPLYEGYMLDDAELVFVAYGIVSRELKSVVQVMRKNGYKAGLFRPVTLWPFPETALREIAAKVQKFFVSEMSAGMLYNDIKLFINDGREIGFCPSYGGKLPAFDTLYQNAVDFLKKG